MSEKHAQTPLAPAMGPTPGMQPMYQPAQPMTAAVMPRKTDEQGNVVWNKGLCTDCCGGYWWKAFCCPCLAYGENRTRLAALRTTGQPHPEGGDQTGSDCALFCIVNALVGVGWVFEMINRSDVRERYSVKGSGCGDCCVAFWCTPCSMTQINNQLKDEEMAFMGHQQGFQQDTSGHHHKV